MTKDEATYKGFLECVELLGRDYYEKYEDNSCTGWGVFEKGWMRVLIGISETPPKDDGRILAGEKPFEKYVAVEVNMETGETREVDMN